MRWSRGRQRDAGHGGRHYARTPLNGPANVPPVRAAPMAGGLGIDKSDYDTFEKLMRDTQLAFGREDSAALRNMATPEMALPVRLAGRERQEGRRQHHPSRACRATGESWREGDAVTPPWRCGFRHRRHQGPRHGQNRRRHW
jgi:hypothetical protein